MMNSRPKSLIALTVGALGFALGIGAAPVGAQTAGMPLGQSSLTAQPDVHFDQRVNTQIPLDLTFQESTGETVKLGRFFNGKQPVILVLPFYKCTSGCTLELHGMVRAFNKMQYDAGKNFQVLTISINPKEGPTNAAVQKSVYLKDYTRPGVEKGWHFLTGTQENIQALTKIVGFKYVYNLDAQQFLHPNGIIVLTPHGRTYRYFYGTEFDPRDLKIALIKASENQMGTIIDQLISLCCAYDITTGHYGVIIQRVIVFAGCTTVLILGSSILLLLRWEKKHAIKQQQRVAEYLAARNGAPKAQGEA